MIPYAILIPGFSPDLYRLTPGIEHWYTFRIPPYIEGESDFTRRQLYQNITTLRYAQIYLGYWDDTRQPVINISEKRPGLTVGRGPIATTYVVSTLIASRALFEIGYTLLPEGAAYKFWLKEQLVFAPYQNLTGGNKIKKEE